ncbi:MAG: hypothetical protein ACLSCV_00465 [Acutalibacteraceae bacterium]
MSDQNMDPKKRNIIIGCSVAGAVVVIAAIIAVIFTTGALNKIGIGSSSANTVSYSDTERFSQGISIEGIDISGMTKEEAMDALLQAEIYPKGYDIQLTLEDQTVALTGKRTHLTCTCKIPLTKLMNSTGIAMKKNTHPE